VLLLGGNDFGKEGTKILAQLEDDDDSVCTIMEEGVGHDEDDETFHSAKTSNTKASSNPRKSNARTKALAAGLMGGLTGISEK
jgi:hypothetical protein